MSMFGAFANSDPASQNNFNPSWMGQTFNATSGVPRSAGGRPNGEGEEDRPMAPPIFMNNRYGREDVLALYDGGSVQPPDGLRRCALFNPEPQPPCVIKPLSDIEKKLRENINSSKAMSMLSASERHHITSGGQAPESPQQQQTLNRNNSNGWTHVPPRDHSKTWGRTPTGTPPVRNPVRGAFTGGRGGGTAGSSPADGSVASPQTSVYGVSPNSATGTAQNGERALGTGGTFPSRRGVNPVARGGGVGASSFNSRAQGLYNPHDPSDRPRQRGRSTSEDGEGGPTTTPTTPGVGGAVNVGQGGGGGGAWQQPQSRPAWGRQGDQPQRMPEWAQDDETGAPGGVSREHSTEVTSGTFDEQGRFVRTASGRTQQQTQHEPHHTQSIHAASAAAWGTMDSQPIAASTTAPMDISSHSSYSMAPQQSQQQQPQADLSGGMSGMSPSSTFMYALQQKQLQAQQQQAAQYAAMQAAQAQAAVPAAPPKPATFFYLDPSGVERGPFQQDQMEAWFHMGYFQETLQVRRDSDKSFIELGELQKRNGKEDPFKYIEPVVVAPAPLPTPNMLAGYMDHQLGLGSAGGWEQSMFRGAQPSSSFEALMEKQRRDQQERAIAEEREKLQRMQEIYRQQQETEREQAARLLREKEEGLQKMQEEMLRQQRDMEERLREHEREKMEIERKKAELEKQSNREKEEQKKKEDAERRKIEEAAEKRRAEQERLAAAEEAEREKERAKVRAEEMKRQAEEDKKRREEERKRADAFARAEELRQEAEREAAVERERQAQIAAARKAAAPPPTAAAVATPPASGNTTPVVKSSGPAWGGAGISAAQTTAKKTKETRTLAEVMAEEERQARAEQRENERLKREAEAAAPKAVASKGGVWGGSTPASIAAQAAPVSSGSAAWGGAGLAKNGPSKSSPWAGPSLAEANKPKAAAKPAAAPAKAKVPEKKKDEKKSGVSAEAAFTSWFITRAKQMNDTVDGAVLASFIQDIANPDEVEDYMVGYLGEGKQVKEFVREYIHKRSELRNKMKAPGAERASASTSHSDKDGFSAVAPKKGAAAGKKKAKFVVDSACLGFRATGDPNRVNQGEIDHPEPAAGRR